MFKFDRPEHELLFRIARRERGVVREPLNWDYLLATALAHGLLPLLHKNIDRHATDVPGYFLSRLKHQAVANSQTVLHLVAKQLRIYKLFREHGVQVALFKGPLLAQMAFGEISLRQAGDIDLLINREHFGKARELLQSLGYQMIPELTPAQLASHLRNHCEIQFMRDDWFTVVDVHWELAPRSFVFKVNAEEVMSRLQSISLAGTTVETFNAEDMVLYQSMHGAKHLWRRLEWIISLAELLRRTPALSWDTVVTRAFEAHSTRLLALGLRLVKECSNVEVPAHVFAAVDADGAMQRMAARIRQQIFTKSGAADSTETNLYNLRIMDRKRDVLFSALRAVFVPTLPDWQALALPAPLHSLYYAFRPLRLSQSYTAALWRRVRRRGPEARNE